MLPDLTRRELIPELMDDPAVDVHELFPSLAFLAAVNKLPGASDLVVKALEPLRGRPLALLDVGAGGADVALETARRLSARVVALDLHARTVEYAKSRAAGSPDVRCVRGDALALPFPDKSFDVAYTTNFMHHLDDQQAVTCLREMDRVSRNGVLVVDLERSRLAYVGVRLVTFLANRIARHDGPVSVRRAFTVPELEAAARAAGLRDLRLTTHVPFRLMLRSA